MDLAVYKIMKTDKVNDVSIDDHKKNKPSLTVNGFSPDGDVLFEFNDTAQNLTQKFGFNLKYYRANQLKDFRD
jgi:hypothetical protein